MSRYRSRPATDSHSSTTTVTSPNTGPWWGPSPRGYNELPDHYTPVINSAVVRTGHWPGVSYLHIAVDGQPACGPNPDPRPVATTDDGDDYLCGHRACFGEAIL